MCFRIFLTEILREFQTPILLISPPRISAIFLWLYTAPCGFGAALLADHLVLRSMDRLDSVSLSLAMTDFLPLKSRIFQLIYLHFFAT